MSGNAARTHHVARDVNRWLGCEPAVIYSCSLSGKSRGDIRRPKDAVTAYGKYFSPVCDGGVSTD